MLPRIERMFESDRARCGGLATRSALWRRPISQRRSEVATAPRRLVRGWCHPGANALLRVARIAPHDRQFGADLRIRHVEHREGERLPEEVAVPARRRDAD